MLDTPRSTKASLDFRPVAQAPGTPLLLADAVSAGFPAPAQDCQEGRIDLNRELVLIRIDPACACEVSP